jgi:hypothetical protein
MKHSLRAFLFLIIIGLFVLGSGRTAKAQSPDGNWSDFENISNTPTASTYPCIVADMQGYVHVFWSENVGGVTRNPLLNPDGTPSLDSRGNLINNLQASGNTLYYTWWDGKEWLEPIDVFTNSQGNIEYPRAAIDPKGKMHIVWVSTSGATAQVLYSRVFTGEADSARAWSQPVVLVDRTLYAYYPVDIAIDSAGGLHVFYFKLDENPGAYAINSTDGGNTWSDPIQVFLTQDPNGGRDGISPLELAIDAKDRLHATWTRYDSTGNGKAVYYSQSSDLGKTWSRPFEVAKWQPGWYETDWLSTGVIGDEVHLVWEGGKIAYQNERISRDGGQTWGENTFILQNLVGENGFANYVVDSAHRLYLLIVKRADPNSYAHGVWFTSWDRDHWLDPVLLGTRNLLLYEKAGRLDAESLKELTRGTFTGNGLRYQMSTVVNGNQLFVVVVNEWDGDIWSSHTTLDAPGIPPKIYPQPTELPEVLPTILPTSTSVPLLTPTPTLKFQPSVAGHNTGFQPAYILLFGLIPALIIVVGIFVYINIRRN